MSALLDLVTETRDTAEAEMRKLTEKADSFNRSLSKTEKTDYDSWEASKNLAEAKLIKLEAEQATRDQQSAAVGQGGGLLIAGGLFSL